MKSQSSSFTALASFIRQASFYTVDCWLNSQGTVGNGKFLVLSLVTNQEFKTRLLNWVRNFMDVF